MFKNKVIIIGSGLGGLSTALLLSKNAYDVSVYEQSTQVGGCLQCFMRNGVKFETGMHFIGSADTGQTLDKLLTYLEIKDSICLSRLDPKGYDVVSILGSSYKFANGRDNFIEQMANYFPSQKDNLKRYFDLVELVAGASSVHSLKNAESDSAINTEYQLRSINEVIDSIITDPLLAKVLVGNLPLYAAEKDKTPFSTHAFIVDFYNQSSYRVVGGSDSIAKALVKRIELYGGQVHTLKKVTKINCNNERATSVVINDDEVVEADYIISAIHPKRTLELIDSKLIRPAFRNRINSIPQTSGVFSVYVHFKENTVPYMNYNFYGYNYDNPWGCESYDESTWPKGYLYMHQCHESSPSFAKTGVILSYMKINELIKWLGTHVGRRGLEYEEFKKEKAKKLISSLEKHFPGLRNNICHYYTSTPLTYLDYTGTEDGSMYGCAKDITLGTACKVPHRTKIPNVLLTGQNINSHGILGVLVGTIVTCSDFLTSDTIYKQIINSNV